MKRIKELSKKAGVVLALVVVGATVAMGVAIVKPELVGALPTVSCKWGER